MKKTALFIMMLITAMAIQAQTLNVVTGAVTYQIPAAQAGEMIYSNGENLTILGKTFTLADITEMYVDDSEVTDNTVAVNYNEQEARLIVAGNCMQFLTIEANGANIRIYQSEDQTEEITYTLSGSSTDGSFYMDGSLKATVALNDLNLTSSITAPVNIRNGKRIDIILIGESTLKDSASSDGKGTLMVNGHSEITGDGILNLYGYCKHAYWADEYVQLKASMTGTINIQEAAGDGINVNQYFIQNGGTLNIQNVSDDGVQVSADTDEPGYALIQGGNLSITTSAAGSKGLKTDGDIVINATKSTPNISIKNTGTGVWDSEDSEVKGSACISSDTNITIDGGEIELTATANGGKGMKCDAVFTMNDGNLIVSTSGKRYSYNSDYSSPKGIKAGVKATGNSGAGTGDIQINGGTISVKASGAQDGSEGIESKNTLTVNGGNVYVESYDDAINTASNMYIKGGSVTVVSKNNDGLDANANIYIEGGTILACGGSAPECSIDAAERYYTYFNGGTILGIGGSSVSPSSSSAQAWVTSSGTATAGTEISLSDGDTQLCTFTVPEAYSSSSSGGGWRPGGGGSQIIISCAGITSGSKYTLQNGTSSSSVSGTQSSSGGGRW